MSALDINLKKLKKNAFRYSKVRGETASRIRIPGGVIDAKSLGRVVEIAEKYGTGTINITNRQGIEIPGIRLEDMDKVNEEVQLIIDSLRINQPEKGKGYRPAERHPDLFHGVGPFELATGVPKKNKQYPDYTDVFSKTLIQLAAEDPNMVYVIRRKNLLICRRTIIDNDHFIRNTHRISYRKEAAFQMFPHVVNRKDNA